MIKTSLNNGLKLATNSVAVFQTQRPAKSSEVFEGWLPRIVGGSLARPLGPCALMIGRYIRTLGAFDTQRYNNHGNKAEHKHYGRNY
jgi:hypothetical protein